jgi:hypothetical protein
VDGSTGPSLRRRRFLHGTAAALLSAAGYQRVGGANERLGIGFIGYGLIGKRHVLDFKEQPDVTSETSGEYPVCSRRTGRSKYRSVAPVRFRTCFGSLLDLDFGPTLPEDQRIDPRDRQPQRAQNHETEESKQNREKMRRGQKLLTLAGAMR